SALPAWQMVDPLPVLAAAGAVKFGRDDTQADEPEVERLFDERSPSPTRAAPPADKPPSGDPHPTEPRP
ncbi:MAG: hypothetical protein Q8L92_15610, partial [Rubrivivax sp.]|nr:hypothetical protein [Rubrivivax sp.]